MTLTEYYKMIAEVDGRPIPEQDPRVTNIELAFRGGPGKEGSATIHLLDGVPAALSWYIWDLSDEYLMEQVQAALTVKVKRTNVSGGNGHCYADLEVVS